jgi:uncharacterized protein YecT (DUF1311 family)
MDDFEYSWDFGEVSELKKDKGLLEEKVIVLNKELDLRHAWVKHHQKSVELLSAKEHFTNIKFIMVVKELEQHDPIRAKQLKEEYL